MRLTIPAVMDYAASHYGDQIAIAEPAGPRLSFRELNDQAIGIAAALAAAGIDAGDRVAIWSPNTHHWVLAALGALSAGATLVPVNTRFTGPEALDVIGRSGATALFVAGPFLGIDRLSALQPADQAEPGQLRNLRLITQIPVEEHDISRRYQLARRHRAGLGGAGTAGAGGAEDGGRKPRGRDQPGRRQRHLVHLRHDRPEQGGDELAPAGARRGQGVGRLRRRSLRSDRYLVLNPFFHSFGYKAGILVCLLTGATVVPQLVYDPEQAMRLIESRADHRPARRAHDLPDDPRPPGTAPSRSVQPAARRDRGGRRAGRAGRADAV